MPGSEDRQPADADRPPVSRVGDELQQRTDAAEAGADPEQLEEEAFDEAKKKGWDKEQTNQA